MEIYLESPGRQFTQMKVRDYSHNDGLSVKGWRARQCDERMRRSALRFLARLRISPSPALSSFRLRYMHLTFTILRRFQTSRAYIYGASRASTKLWIFGVRFMRAHPQVLHERRRMSCPMRASLSRPLFLPVRDPGSNNPPPCSFISRAFTKRGNATAARKEDAPSEHPLNQYSVFSSSRLRISPPPEYTPWTKLRSAE